MDALIPSDGDKYDWESFVDFCLDWGIDLDDEPLNKDFAWEDFWECWKAAKGLA